jgi:hypothetical protein
LASQQRHAEEHHVGPHAIIETRHVVSAGVDQDGAATVLNQEGIGAALLVFEDSRRRLEAGIDIVVQRRDRPWRLRRMLGQEDPDVERADLELLATLDQAGAVLCGALRPHDAAGRQRADDEGAGLLRDAGGIERMIEVRVRHQHGIDGPDLAVLQRPIDRLGVGLQRLRDALEEARPREEAIGHDRRPVVAQQDGRDAEEPRGQPVARLCRRQFAAGLRVVVPAAARCQHDQKGADQRRPGSRSAHLPCLPLPFATNNGRIIPVGDGS